MGQNVNLKTKDSQSAHGLKEREGIFNMVLERMRASEAHFADERAQKCADRNRVLEDERTRKCADRNRVLEDERTQKCADRNRAFEDGRPRDAGRTRNMPKPGA